MATTLLSNVVNPQVMADMISASLPKKIKFSAIAKIDTTLAGQAGNTITVPKFGYIGDAVDVAENTPIDTTALSHTTTTATVKKAGKAIEITDEAVLSGYGNPMGEGTSQLTMSIAAKVDNDCHDALLNASAVYNGTAAKIGYSGVVNANALMADESDTTLNKIIFIHPDQESTLRLDTDFTDRSKSGMDVIMTGTIGTICGCQVVKSKKVRKVEFEVKAATAEGYTEITTSNIGTYAGKTGINEAGEYVDLAVGQFVKAVAAAYWLNPIVVVDVADPNEAADADRFANETPAITIYLKRDVQVESDRDILKKTTVISVDEHYVAVLSNDSKVVLAKFQA